MCRDFAALRVITLVMRFGLAGTERQIFSKSGKSRDLQVRGVWGE
jgi:hypothetical protein